MRICLNRGISLFIIIISFQIGAFAEEPLFQEVYLFDIENSSVIKNTYFNEDNPFISNILNYSNNELYFFNKDGTLKSKYIESVPEGYDVIMGPTDSFYQIDRSYYILIKYMGLEQYRDYCRHKIPALSVKHLLINKSGDVMWIKDDIQTDFVILQNNGSYMAFGGRWDCLDRYTRVSFVNIYDNLGNLIYTSDFNSYFDYGQCLDFNSNNKYLCINEHKDRINKIMDDINHKFIANDNTIFIPDQYTQLSEYLYFDFDKYHVRNIKTNRIHDIVKLLSKETGYNITYYKLAEISNGKDNCLTFIAESNVDESKTTFLCSIKIDSNEADDNLLIDCDVEPLNENQYDYFDFAVLNCDQNIKLISKYNRTNDIYQSLINVDNGSNVQLLNYRYYKYYTINEDCFLGLSHDFIGVYCK